MKKLLAIGLLCFLVGCSESPRDENGHPIAEKDGNEFSVRINKSFGSIDFRYIVIDKHEYLLMTGVHISGLTHSPKCPCQNNKLILDVAPPETNFPPIHAIELVNTCTNNWVTNQVFGGGI